MTARTVRAISGLFFCLCFIGCGQGDKPSAAEEVDGSALELVDLVARDDGVPMARLKASDGRFILSPVEACPASAIALRLEDFVFPRPLTVDLFLNIVEKLDLSVLRIDFDWIDERPVADVALTAGLVLRTGIGDALALHQVGGAPMRGSEVFLVHYEETEQEAGKFAQVDAGGMSSVPNAHRAQGDGQVVDMRVLGLIQSDANLAVVLVDGEGGRAFPVFVGFCQAAAIYATLGNEDGIETRSHELVGDLLAAGRTSVEYALINELRGDTYIGALGLLRGSAELELDARPSDALILALRSGAPVRLNADLLAAFGEDAAPYLGLFAGGAAGKRPFVGDVDAGFCHSPRSGIH